MNTERQKKYAELRQRLVDQRDRTYERVRAIHADQQRESMELEKDPEDQAIQLENDEVLDALEPATRREFGQILGALERLEEGQYGTCVDCGDEIAMKRLEAIPFAVRCVECAEEHEGEQRQKA